MRKVAKKFSHVDQLPLFKPEVKWVCPPQSEWPDFKGAEYLGVDTETFDPHILKKGPGFIRGDAEVIGISLADEDGRKIYLPIGHVEGNCDRDAALRYVRHQLKDHDQKKCGANLHYDMESLWSIGVELNGPLCDVQIAEPLLDEEREGGYSLERLSLDYLGYGKNEADLRAAADAYGLDAKKHMKYLPAGHAAEYAEDDAYNSVLIFIEQEEKLKDDGVWSIFSDVEQPLQRVLFKMRLKGVKVDLDRAEQLAKSARKKESDLYMKLRQDAGFAINVNSSNHVGRYLESKGVQVPRTLPTAKNPDGQYSVVKDWLETLEDPAGRLLRDYRVTVKMRKDFLEGMILNSSVKGRLHSQWNQLRKTKDEDGGGSETQGTRSGRIAAANVNLTQIPVRDPEWGKPIRSCFIADHGGIWGKKDFSQQEPRILLHFAYLMGMRGAAEVRRQYVEDPTTDYHQATADTILKLTGKKLERRPAKDINLGRAYGMGVDKLARKLGVSVEKAREIIAVYDAGVPYVNLLADACKERVSLKGFITTILGRKRRFNLWEKAFSYGKGSVPTDYQTAVNIYGRDKIVRAGLNKAMNALVQGSAGDQTKRAIVMMDAEGLLPSLQVYDEIDGSYNSIEEIERATVIMEQAIETTVPMDASPDIGQNWGDLKPHHFERKTYFFEKEHF